MLQGMKAIKNDYGTNVMYDIEKVNGKLQIYVSHHPIDLSTMLIPNNGSLEESFAAKYICPNATLAEMMNHVIIDYTSDSEDERKEVTPIDYTFDQMIEWAEQEHFENEETKEVHRHKAIWKNRMIFVRDKMRRDVITVGSTMWIPLLYQGEYSQWSKRFMNYLEEQTDGEAMINSLKNGEHPFLTAEEKKTKKIDRLTRSLLIQGPSNDIYSLIDSNDTAKDLWDALERQMRGSEYGEQDRKAAILYEYETFKATEGEQLLDTYLRYLQVINDLKKCGYKKDNCELNYKFLNNLQPEWKQYGTLMRQTKNLMDINIDALYNILKQNQGDVNDAMGYKKKAVVVTSDPLALVAEKTKVSKRKEKVVVQSESEGSDDEDISDLKKITALLAKAFNRKKYYAKPTNNNLRTSSASSSANKKPEYVKSEEKKEDKKVDEKKRDMSKVKCYNCKKEGHFAKDCKKAKVKDYNYYKTKMLLAKKDSDEQVLLVEDQAWMESSSDSDQEINANMVFMAKIEKIHLILKVNLNMRLQNVMITLLILVSL
ncbi:retrovirus-related pol polyprotein from transposon TNT 1-94 [Tanacetum coccineum]